MKTNAIRLYEYGTSGVLQWEEIDVPDPVDWFGFVANEVQTP